MPIVGMNRRSGRRIGSVIAYDQRQYHAPGRSAIHDSSTRTISAICTTVKTQRMNSLIIAAGPPVSDAYRNAVCERTNPSSESSKIPASATAASAPHGALDGRPPARATRRSIGRISGSTDVRMKRDTAPNGESFRVRTIQSTAHTTASTAATPNTPTRSIASAASNASRKVCIARSDRPARPEDELEELRQRENLLDDAAAVRDAHVRVDPFLVRRRVPEPPRLPPRRETVDDDGLRAHALLEPGLAVRAPDPALLHPAMRDVHHPRRDDRVVYHD